MNASVGPESVQRVFGHDVAVALPLRFERVRPTARRTVGSPSAGVKVDAAACQDGGTEIEMPWESSQ